MTWRMLLPAMPIPLVFVLLVAASAPMPARVRSDAGRGSHAGKGSAPLPTNGLSALRFIEQRGQFDLTGESASTRFVLVDKGMVVLFSPSGVRYVFMHDEALPEGTSEASGLTANGLTHTAARTIRRTTHAVDVRFADARPFPRVRGAGPPEASFHYYLHTAPDGITDVPSYSRIVYEEVYPGIDVVFDVRSGTLKSEFLVRPGASPSDIRLISSGMTAQGLTGDGAVRTITPLGELLEGAPRSYPVAADVRSADTPLEAAGPDIPSRWTSRDGALGFDVEGWSGREPLLIDPPILWSTYYGGLSSDVGNDITVSSAGDILITGLTTSATAIATSGTHQTVYIGPSSDAFVAKFAVDGSLVWGTYFGGTLYEGGKSVALTPGGDVIVTGFTASASGVASAGAHQTTYGGGAQDAFVAAFSASGTRVWSTYLGGGGYEDGNGVAVDRNGTVIVTGWTSSTTGFATPGAHQASMAGVDDAFLVQFTASGVRLWGTYVGGTRSDWGESVTTNSSNDIILAGRTNSGGGISTPGAYQSTYGGGPFYGDGFLAAFSTTGVRHWGTYIGGGGDDWVSDVAVSPNDEIVVTGYTESSNAIATAGTFQTIYNGAEDAFAMKFSPSGQRRWGTYIGGGGQDRARGIDVYDNTYIMVTGFTKSSSGIATPGAHQTGFAGGLEGDAFVVELNSGGARVCGTYLGGPDGDVGMRIATDGQGYMYVLGYTTSQTGVATQTAHQTAFGGVQDAFLARFDLCLQSNTSSVTTQAVATGPYCAGDSITVPFTVRGSFDSQNTFTAYLSDENGSFNIPSFIGSVQGTSAGSITGPIPVDAVSGTRYRVRIVSSDPFLVADDNGADITIHPKPPGQVIPFTSQFICPGQSVTFRASTGPGLSYQWFRWETAIPGETTSTLRVSESGTFAVRIRNANGCESIGGPVTVTVAPPPARAGDDRVICPGGSVQIGDPLPETIQSFTFRWYPSEGLSATNVPKPTASPKVTTVYHLVLTDTTGCRGEDSVAVVVAPPVTVDLGRDVTICKGTQIALTANITSGMGPFDVTWEPADGLSTATGPGTLASPVVTTRYIARVDGAHGCFGFDTIWVSVMPQPQPFIVAQGPTTFCQGDSVRLSAPPGYASYRWSTLDTTREIVVRASGSYFVIATDASGCSGASEPIVVTIRTPDPPRIDAAPSTMFCAGDTVTLTAPAGFRAYRWSSGERTRSIRVRATGTWSVAVLDSAGCTVDSEPISIVQRQRPLPRIFGAGTVCINTEHVYSTTDDSSLIFTWRVTGGTIISGNGTRSVRIRWGSGTLGVIDLEEIDRGSGCSGVTRTNITIGSSFIPDVVREGPATICDGDSVVLRATPGLASYRWNTGDSTDAIIVRQAGSYVVVGVDSGGCTGPSLPVVIDVLPRPMARIAGLDSACAGDEASYTAPAAPGVSYEWRMTGGIIIGDSTDPLVLVRWLTPPAGMLTVVVRDLVTGCTDSASTDIRVSAPPVVRILPDGDSSACDGTAVVLRVDPPDAGARWSTGETGDSLIVRLPGTYTVEVTGDGGCRTVSPPVTIRFTARPTVRMTGVAAVCIGSVAIYTADIQPGDSLQWRIPPEAMLLARDDSSVTVRWDAPGTSRIGLRVIRGGCSAEDSILVTAAATLEPVVSVSGSTALCPGDSVELDAGAGFASYRWSTGQASRRITVGAPGAYTVRVEDAGGCSGVSRDTVFVTLRSAPSPVISGPTAFCEGDSIVLRVTGAAGAVVWSTGERTSAIVLRRGGLVSVRVTDSTGCSGDSPPHLVTMHPAPLPPVVTWDGVLLTSEPRLSYQWMLAGIDVAGATDRSVRPSVEGWYRVRTLDANGCVSLSDSIQVRFADQLTAIARLPELEAEPGMIVEIPVLLPSAVNFDRAALTEFRATVLLPASLLSPLPPHAGAPISGGTRQISLRIPLTRVPSSGDTLAVVRARALLGPVLDAPLQLAAADWTGAAVTTILQDGRFRLLPCTEGGPRLFDADGTLALVQNRPNPFNAMTVIGFSTIEDGRTRLLVSDALGRTIATLVDADLPAGYREVAFDASELPSGVYYCVLLTPSQSTTMRMHVVK